MRRLDNDKKYSYTLIDSHFKADSFTKGRAFKSFFDKFCQNIFETNLTMLEDIDCFPIAYNESNAYASIAHALHSLTPYAWSEVYITYKDKKAKTAQSNNKKDDKEKWRFVDFWCMNDRQDFEVWIEVKRLWLSIDSLAFDSDATKYINDALEQIYKICDESKKSQIASDTNFKVAFFTIPIYCSIKSNKMPSDSDIDKAPKAVADLLAEFIDNRRNMGVLCAVLDLDTQGEKDELIYEGEYTPYFALGAIVLE